MSTCSFSPEEQEILRNNPYIFSVTEKRITLTKEFKEIMFSELREGKVPRRILEDYGFDLDIIGETRIRSIAMNVRKEYIQYGKFKEGRSSKVSNSTYQNLSDVDDLSSSDKKEKTDANELRQLRYEVDYLKQEVEFLKKISSIRTSEK